MMIVHILIHWIKILTSNNSKAKSILSFSLDHNIYVFQFMEEINYGSLLEQKVTLKRQVEPYPARIRRTAFYCFLPQAKFAYHAVI